jgi:outer membrane lipoprotein-sorting protein
VIATVIGLALLQNATPLPARQTAESIAAHARAVLVRAAEAQRDVATLRASYVQVRTTELLPEPLESRGTLLFRRSPACIVFHAREPSDTRIRIDATAYQVYRPEQRRCERIELSVPDLPKALFGALTPEPSALERRFVFAACLATDETDTVVLEPRDEGTRQVLTRLEIVVRRQDAAVVGVAYRDASGDDVRIELREIAPNPKDLDADVFSAAVPKDVTVSVRRQERRR